MADAQFVRDLIPVGFGFAALPHQDVPLPNHSILIARYQRSNFRERRPIVATYVLIRRSLVSMNDDLIPVSRCAVSRHLMQTHEALNVRIVLVEHARESATKTCEILRSELRLYVKVGAVNIHRRESRRSARSGLQITNPIIDATMNSHIWVTA